MIEKIRTLYRQFIFYEFLRYLLSYFSKKVLDPFATLSYAQQGEDIIIDLILGYQKKGFYIDVGSHLPHRMSNTFRLYKRGWKGICIDANPRLIQISKKIRPRDINLSVLVSDRNDSLLFTEFYDPAVSSVNHDHVVNWSRKRKIKHQRQVESKTLDTILQELDIPKEIDLLTIDVENHDYEVLSSINLDQYRPKLIVIEMHGLDLLDIQQNIIFQYLRTNHYTMVSYAGDNGFFTRADGH